MTSVFNEFKSFVEALGLSKQVDENGNELLAITSDMNVTGNTTLSDVALTGSLTVGLVEIDPMNNSLNVLGASCFNPDTGAHNQDLCDAQALNIQSGLSGNVNLFDGEIIIEPNGNITLKGTIKAETIEAKAFSVDTTTTTATTAGRKTIPAGKTTIQIKTTALTENTLILVTPRGIPVPISTENINDTTFEIRMASPLDQDIQVDWLIIGQN